MPWNNWIRAVIARNGASLDPRLKTIGACLAILCPNVFLVLIQSNPDGLRGSYYEIFTVAPNFLLYYSIVILLSVVLLVVAVVRRSSTAGFTAYFVLGSSLFMPHIVDFDWLMFIDNLTHGRWVAASTVHFAQIFPYYQWPGAWTVWLVVSRVSGIDPIRAGVVMLGADWILRLTATATLAKILVRQTRSGEYFSYVLASFILVLFQYQWFNFNNYSDAGIGQSISIIVLYLLLRERLSLSYFSVIVTLWISLVITHPFYSIVLSCALFGLLLVSNVRRYRTMHSTIFLAFVLIFALWITYFGYTGFDQFLKSVLSTSPHLNLIRTQTLQVLEPLPLPFYGVVFRQSYKYVVLPAVAILYLVYMIRGRLPRTSKLVINLFTISSASVLAIFIFVPGFEARVVTFALFGLSMVAGLQICGLIRSSGVRMLAAIALLVLVVTVPFFLTLEPQIYSNDVTPSILSTVDFSSHYPNYYFAVFPVSVYLSYTDPYGLHQNGVGEGSGGSIISPRPGLTFILTVPPGQLSTNAFQELSYSSSWNSSDRVYVSGGVVAYYYT
jgi:hypothetical protein